MDHLLVMKGAPERIIERCSTMLVNNTECQIDNKALEDFNKAYLELGGMGERVLGFAELHLNTKDYPINFEFNSDEPNFPLDGLRFLGLKN